MKLVDLSHTIRHGLVTYRGLPSPVLSDHLSREGSRKFYAPGTEFHIGKIEMVANTGTYLDSPFHRYADGDDLSELELGCMAGLEGIVISMDWAKGRGIGREYFVSHDVAGKAVLVRTGWDSNWATEKYFEGHPFLNSGAAEFLAESGATLVGIDSLNIDDTADLTRPAHSLLLRRGIPIVEHLCNLKELPDRGFLFYAVPPKVKNFGTFPVRAFATIP